MYTMFRIGYIITIAITLQLLLESLEAEDPLKGLYPDTRKCFDGIPQNVTASFHMINPLNEKCLKDLSINKMGENPLCFKACVLDSMFILAARPYPQRHDLKDLEWDELLRIESEGAEVFKYEFFDWVVADLLLEFYEGIPKEDEVKSKEDATTEEEEEEEHNDTTADHSEGESADVEYTNIETPREPISPPSESYVRRQKALYKITRRIKKCEKYLFEIVKNEQRECQTLSPVHREKLEKLMGCFDKAMKC